MGRKKGSKIRTGNQPAARPLTLTDELERWVAEAAPHRIVQDMVRNAAQHADRRASLRRMEDALEAAAEKGVGHLIELNFREMIRFTTGLMLRLQFLAGRAVSNWDHAMFATLARTPEELSVHLLPALERVQGHLVELAKSYASVQHTLKIARAPAVLAAGEAAADVPGGPPDDPQHEAKARGRAKRRVLRLVEKTARLQGYAAAAAMVEGVQVEGSNGGREDLRADPQPPGVKVA